MALRIAQLATRTTRLGDIIIPTYSQIALFNFGCIRVMYSS